MKKVISLFSLKKLCKGNKDLKNKKIFKDYKENNKDVNTTVVILITFLIASFLALLIMIRGFNRFGFWCMDMDAIKYVKTIQNYDLNRLMIIITTSGNFLSIFLITIIVSLLLVYKIGKVQGAYLAVNILGIWLFNELLKIIFKRERPSKPWLVNATGYSLPSGHAMISMGLALLLVYFIFTYFKRKWASSFCSSLILLYALMIGLSRVYVGVHYISDVIIGWLTAMLWVSISLLVFKAFNNDRT